MLLPSELSLPRSRDSITAEVDDGGRQSRVPPQRRTAKRRAMLILSVLKGDTSARVRPGSMG